MAIKILLYCALLTLSLPGMASYKDEPFNLGQYNETTPIGKGLCLRYEITERFFIDRHEILLNKIHSLYDGVTCLQDELTLPSYIYDYSVVMLFGLFNQLGIHKNNIIDGEDLDLSESIKNHCKHENCPDGINEIVDIEYFDGKGRVESEYSIYFYEDGDLNSLSIVFSSLGVTKVQSFVIMNDT